ncbi:enoyl-CoA hydratase-related protein [Thioclava sp. FR2]|uniref:enoyl-CoA hydratase-related protein n=1 Tax=Thioclava sp. FR2 TaxID=3445780 RepID=UPI003EB91979
MTREIRTIFEQGRLELVLEAGRLAADFLARQEMRAALFEAISSRPADVTSILLRASIAAGFSGTPLPLPQDDDFPTVADLCAQIDACSVPVAVLVEGPVNGRGVELFLAAHMRLASSRASFSFAAIAAGRLPGSRATLRLARSVGAEQALRVMQIAQRVSAAEALAIGLVDRVYDQPQTDDVLTAARLAVAGLDSPRPSLDREEGLRDGRGFLRAIADQRNNKGAIRLPAEKALLDCVEAALLLPKAQAQEFVAEREEEIGRSAEAAALTHILRAEINASAVPDGLSAFEPSRVRHLGVSGAEPSFLGLVLTGLSKGVSVTVMDPTRDRLVSFLERVAARQEAAVQSGQMTSAQRDADWARLSPVLDPAALATSDLILASTATVGLPQSKTLPVLMLGRGDLPATAFRLVLTGRMAELGLPSSTPGSVVHTAWAFLRRMGLHVVVTGQQAQSGIAGRLNNAAAASIHAMMGMGVRPNAIREALTHFGQRPPVLEPIADVIPREMSSDEIVTRWLAALANEGARLMQAGVTKSASDIDLVAVAGLGFPRFRGGPMHQADVTGTMILRRNLTAWSNDAPVWAPVGELDALVSVGRGFAGAVTPE